MEFGKKFFESFIVEMLDPAAAIAGNNPELFRIRLKESWNEGASLFFKEPENLHLIFKAFIGLGSTKSFMNPAIEAESNRSPQGILDLEHSVSKKSRLPRRCQSRAGSIPSVDA